MKLTLINHKITFFLQIENFWLLYSDPNTFNKAKKTQQNLRRKKQQQQQRSIVIGWNKNTLKVYNNTNGTPTSLPCHKIWQNAIGSPQGLKIQVEVVLWIQDPLFITGVPHLPVHTTHTHTYTHKHIVKSGTKEIVFWHICFCRLHSFTWEGNTCVCVCTQNTQLCWN